MTDTNPESNKQTLTGQPLIGMEKVLPRGDQAMRRVNSFLLIALSLSGISVAVFGIRVLNQRYEIDLYHLRCLQEQHSYYKAENRREQRQMYLMPTAIAHNVCKPGSNQ